jgi:hypothetical protein
LVEARCAGETLDEIAIELRPDGRSLQTLALRRERLGEIRRALGGRPVRLLTSIPAAVAQVFGECAFTAGGERIEVFREAGELRWRARPDDGPDDATVLRWRDQEVPAAHAAAFAAAVCDPDQVPNLAGQLPGARAALLRRLRDPLVNVAAAASLLLGAAALHFHREAGREKTALAAARQAREELAARLLPGETVPEGRLLSALQRRLAESGEGAASPEGPSALSFLKEIGAHFPDADALGLSLESLDLAPDGGRLAARVPAAKDDPLRNASLLEGALNQSKRLKARGDYAVRENQVQVRLRMEYRP